VRVDEGAHAGVAVVVVVLRHAQNAGLGAAESGGDFMAKEGRVGATIDAAVANSLGSTKEGLVRGLVAGDAFVDEVEDHLT